MMKTNLKITYLFFLIFVFSHRTVIGQHISNIDQKIEKYLQIQQERIGFNGVVMVADENGIIAQQTIGLASIEHNVPLTLDSKFKIASISKTFTGLLISLAEEEGILDLENTLSLYFPEIEDEVWKQITISQLLSHTSGIPHWSGFKDYWAVQSLLPLKKEKILSEIFDMELLFEPGISSAYSSPAFYLLAIILERLFSKSYEKLLHEKIFRPLVLDNTQVFEERAIKSKLVAGYHLISDDSLTIAPPRNMATMKGGGNLFSTAQDLTTWCQSFMTTDIWGNNIIEHTFRPLTKHGIKQKKEVLYGRGWYLGKHQHTQSPIYHVGGGTFGFTSKIAIYPKEKLSIVILTNISTLPLDDIIWRDIEKIVFEEPFEFPKVHPLPIQMDTETLKKFAGTYVANNGMELSTLIHQGRLFAKLGKHPPLEIYPKTNSSFFAKKVEVQFLFKTGDNGEIIGLEAKGRGRVDYFEKK